MGNIIDLALIAFAAINNIINKFAINIVSVIHIISVIISNRFILHNYETGEKGEVIDYRNASSLYFSHFINSAPIKVVIHGFGGGGTKKWVVDMKNALLKSVSPL